MNSVFHSQIFLVWHSPPDTAQFAPAGPQQTYPDPTLASRLFHMFLSACTFWSSRTTPEHILRVFSIVCELLFIDNYSGKNCEVWVSKYWHTSMSTEQIFSTLCQAWFDDNVSDYSHNSHNRKQLVSLLLSLHFLFALQRGPLSPTGKQTCVHPLCLIIFLAQPHTVLESSSPPAFLACLSEGGGGDSSLPLQSHNPCAPSVPLLVSATTTLSSCRTLIWLPTPLVLPSTPLVPLPHSAPCSRSQNTVSSSPSASDW